ncbi:hypothetical protein AB205_0054620 [Aquarana catesbeiana]|uniref:Uncharacterized protein n=1 Tax=Aquarana catesbeiana TaxID=8400 RepID=A0A2G9RKF4_AQUCT|nr:hypothetical protein AB205_0054620 [Aquarana catesbeiana]
MTECISLLRKIINVQLHQQKNQDIVMDLIKQNVLENERLRLKFQQHGKKDSELLLADKRRF